MRSVVNGMPVLLKDFSQEEAWIVNSDLLGNRTATGMTEPQKVLLRIAWILSIKEPSVNVTPGRLGLGVAV